MSTAEITRFTKFGGQLTKYIRLAPDGSIISNSSACVMSSGLAQRVVVVDAEHFATLIDQLGDDQAFALGALREGLPEQMPVVTKDRVNGVEHAIARTGADIVYRQQQPAFALLDYDSKGMPEETAAKMKQGGGFWKTLCSVVPELQDTARVTRRSTSSGLFRSDTGVPVPGSDGLHVFALVVDGRDIERFLNVLHQRCWLAGFGWMMVSASGQLLERSIVDRIVGSPERLVFEAGPILEPPLQQDRDSRRPIAVRGEALNTLATCPPLSIAETAKLHELKAKEAHRLASAAAKARTGYIEQRSWVLAERGGLTAEAATQIVKRSCDGVLLPSLVLPFDDPEMTDCTVGDVLNDPERFEGLTLADPLEGVDYGLCKAKIFRRADGTPWIHSFAHGRTTYTLKHDIGSVRAAMEQVAPDAAVAKLIELMVRAELNAHELEQLRNLAVERSGNISKRALDAMIKEARKEYASRHAQQEQQRRTAERTDPRLVINNPAENAPWHPQVQVLGDVLGGVAELCPPTRDINSDVMQVKKIRIPDTHAFTTTGANAEPEETTDDQVATTRAMGAGENERNGSR